MVFYLVLGFVFAGVVDLHHKSDFHFSIAETLVLVLLWPFCVLYVLLEWLKRWANFSPKK